MSSRAARLCDGAGAEHLGYVRTWSPQTERAADVHAHESWDSGDGVTAVVHVGAEAHVKDATRFVGTELGHAAQVLSFPLEGPACGR